MLLNCARREAKVTGFVGRDVGEVVIIHDSSTEKGHDVECSTGTTDNHIVDRRWNVVEVSRARLEKGHTTGGVGAGMGRGGHKKSVADNL